jgi:hypothetical protein
MNPADKMKQFAIIRKIKKAGMREYSHRTIQIDSP